VIHRTAIALLLLCSGGCRLGYQSHVTDSGPDSADARPACVCNADLDDNTGIGVSDFNILTVCLSSPTDPGCASSDINCDGTIDDCDFAVLQCQWGASGGRPDCCAACDACVPGTDYRCAASVCACNADLDADGQVTLVDTGQMVDCVNDPTGPGCALADINCDGTIDECDIAVVDCALGTRGGNSVCCAACADCSDTGSRCSRPGCDCNPDITNDGAVDIGDFALLSACIEDSRDPRCLGADLSCDGVIDTCEVSAWECYTTPGADRGDCCTRCEECPTGARDFSCVP